MLFLCATDGKGEGRSKLAIHAEKPKALLVWLPSDPRERYQEGFMSTDEQRYWSEYDGLQHAKHKLLMSYLNGWFPILSSWQGRVVYIDCHAGRGRHDSGQEGSPLLALNLLVNHRVREHILANTEVYFYFIEIDQTNYETLVDELQALGELPKNVFIRLVKADYERHLGEVFADIRNRGQQLAPSFAFVDPYGFSLSMDFLNDYLSFPRSELLINFMYRYVDMAIRHESQAENMDSLFGSSTWRELLQIKDPVERSNATINMFSRQLQAKYVTHMYMRGKNGALKYVLIHATNHRRGRELIKEAMWTVAPDGTFTASERNTPGQLVLLIPEPNLDPLRKALWEKFVGQSVKVSAMYDWLVDQLYLPKHLHQVLREYKNSGILQVSDYDGRFAFNKDPTFSFPGERK